MYLLVEYLYTVLSNIDICRLYSALKLILRSLELVLNLGKLLEELFNACVNVQESFIVMVAAGFLTVELVVCHLSIYRASCWFS